MVGMLAACHDHNSASNTGVTPTAINLFPVAQTTENPTRLFIRVTAVGSTAVSLPLAFDTGSSGITLDAPQILPSNIVTSDGFLFPQGESQLLYQGITITNQQGTRSYGNAGGRTEIGNIGYATVTFRDTNGTLTTREMPVFLYYAVHLNDTDETAAPQRQQGWFGVNDAPNPIIIPGSTKPHRADTLNAPLASPALATFRVPSNTWTMRPVSTLGSD
jgi:hypothetical protein